MSGAIPVDAWLSRSHSAVPLVSSWGPAPTKCALVSVAGKPWRLSKARRSVITVSTCPSPKIAIEEPWPRFSRGWW